MSATIEQTRPFQWRGQVEVLFRNGTDETLEFDALRLVDDRFAPVEATPRDVLLLAGHGPLRIPVPFGDPDCDVDDPARAAVEIVRTDGTTERIEADDAGEALMARLHRIRCDRQSIFDAASIEFAAPFVEVDEATIRLALRLTRNEGSEPVTVEDIGGTVVLAVTVVDGGLPVTLGPGDEVAEVTLELSAARCDAHGLIESNKTYRFPTFIRLGDAEPQYVELEPLGEGRALLEDAVERNCT